MKPITITLDGKSYEMRADFNCFCELEEIYGDLDTLFEKLRKPSYKDLRNCIYALIKHEDDSLTPKKVGQIIKGLGEITYINRQVMEAIRDSLPKVDEKNAATQEQTEEK